MTIPLRQLRERDGMTQAELGRKLNVAPSTIGMWEKGYRSPDYENLTAIAGIFNVTTDYLLGLDTAKSPVLSDEQATLLKGFDALNAAGRNVLVAVLDSLRVSHAAAL